MLYCTFAVPVLTLQCKKILPPQIWLLEGPQGVAKNFLGSLSLAIFYIPVINYHIIWPLPLQTPYCWLRGPMSPPILHPAWRLWHLDPWCPRCLELGPPTFQTKVTPMAGPQASHQLNPALTCVRVMTSRLLRALLLTRLTGYYLYTGPPV